MREESFPHIRLKDVPPMLSGRETRFRIGTTRATVLTACLCLIITLCSPAKAETSFGPWHSKVTIADQNIAPKRGAGGSRRTYRKVFNGPQGGGYFLIRFFQVVISPQQGPHCRFNPVCSAYGKQAVEKFGVLLGSMLAGDRILRCNPYSPPGDDPVPDVIFDR